MESRIQLAIAILTLLVPAAAHAQFGCSPIPVVTVPGSVTQDLIVEQSVTTPTTATFTSDDLAYQAISTQSFQTEFPGWVRLPTNSRDVAMSNVMHSLSTYLAADTDSQAHLTAITALANQKDTAVLAAIQTQTVVIANLAQQVSDLTHIMAVAEAEQLNERARAQATESTTWSEWFQSVL